MSNTYTQGYLITCFRNGTPSGYPCKRVETCWCNDDDDDDDDDDDNNNKSLVIDLTPGM